MKKEFKVISDLIEETSRVLDVGCGDGELMKYLFENKNVNIRGLDISKILTHELPVDDFQKAFDIMESGKCGKVILKW